MGNRSPVCGSRGRLLEQMLDALPETVQDRAGRAQRGNSAGGNQVETARQVLASGAAGDHLQRTNPFSSRRSKVV